MKRAVGILRVTIFAAALMSLASVPASASIINQYANSVIGFSSQYSATRNAATQALGAPNVLSPGENYYAWAAAAARRDGTLEFISLGFSTPVFASGVTIRETMGSGFVYEVDLLDIAGIWHTAWSGTDTSPWFPTSYWWGYNGTHAHIAEFLVSFDKTPYRVSGVRVRTNTNTNLSLWEEIDSVSLHGIVPEAGSFILLGLGILALSACRSLWRLKHQ